MQRITPINKDGERELWLTAPRGSIEDFGDYEEWREWGMADNYDQFRQAWLDFFPDETVWYHLQALEDPVNRFRIVLINNQYVLEVDPEKQRQYDNALDIHPFVEWLLESVKVCIREIEAGTDHLLCRTWYYYTIGQQSILRDKAIHSKQKTGCEGDKD